jgi:hypothetical protein
VFLGYSFCRPSPGDSPDALRDSTNRAPALTVRAYLRFKTPLKTLKARIAPERVNELLTAQVRVRDMEGNAIEHVFRYEAETIIAHRAAYGVVNRKRGDPDYLLHLQLIVPLSSYHRILNGMMSPDQPQGVTRARQVAGAKKWVERLDKADTGRPRQPVRSVFMGSRQFAGSLDNVQAERLRTA